MNLFVSRLGKPVATRIVPSSDTGTHALIEFGTLDEMSLCHATAHLDERFSEIVFTNPKELATPTCAMDRQSFTRVM